jgi:hypothetical protein
MEANRTGILKQRSSGRNRGWRRKIKTKKKHRRQRRAGKGRRMLIAPGRFCSIEAARVRSVSRIKEIVIPGSPASRAPRNDESEFRGQKR